jgi:hypothetical protein
MDMNYTEKVLNRYINKALEKYGTTIEEYNKKLAAPVVGKKAKLEPYNITYSFENDSEYQEWRKYVKNDLKRLYPDWDTEKLEEQTNWLDALIGLSQPYLFKKQI